MKSKKLMCMLLATCLVAAFSGCSNEQVDVETTLPSQVVESTDGGVSESTPTETVEESTTPVEEATVVFPKAGVDVSNARTTTSAENPANLGEWVKSTKYSEESGKNETIYWRVTGITFDCQDKIDEYNSGNHLHEFQPLKNEVADYGIVTYEVYFPEDFPASDNGIPSAHLSLEAKSPKGAGIKLENVTYLGLGICWDISEDISVSPGDVFTGEAVYTGIDNPSAEYTFNYSHDVDGSESQVCDYVAHN